MAEDARLGAILVEEDVDSLGDWDRDLSAYLRSDEKEVLGSGACDGTSGRVDLECKVIS